MTKMMLEFKDVRLARKLGQSTQETYVQSVITSAVVWKKLQSASTMA